MGQSRLQGVVIYIRLLAASMHRHDPYFHHMVVYKPITEDGKAMNGYGPVSVVNLTNPLNKSLQGKYFLGETDQLIPIDANRT